MEHENKYLLTQGSIYKKLMFFAIPILIGNLFQQLYNTVDSLIVGNYLGHEALAAVTSTGSLIYLVLGFFNGLAMGAGTIIARFIGAGDRKAVTESVHTATALSLLCGICVSIAGWFGAGTVLKLMGCPDDVLPLSSRYLSIYFGGSIFMIIYNVFVGILQASGDSRHPLYYLITSSIINVILDFLFIGRLHMGVEGAAIATVIAQAFSTILAGMRLTRTESIVSLHINLIRFTPDRLRLILRYGIPTGTQAAVIDFSNVLIQSFINSFGSAAMAGFGAYAKIEGFAFLPVMAFQMAITTFVSQNIGAKELERARKGILIGVGTTILISEAVGLTACLFARPLLGIFSSGEEVITYGLLRATICSPLMFMPAFTHAMSAVMRGVGKPVTPMFILLGCWCLVRVVVLFTVGRFWHSVLLICWIYPFTWLISTIVYIICAFRLRKEFPWLRGVRKA